MRQIITFALVLAPFLHGVYAQDCEQIVSNCEALLEKNTPLKSLDLSRNQIDAEGACALAAALEKNTSLTNLALWVNQNSAATGLGTPLSYGETDGGGGFGEKFELDIDNDKTGEFRFRVSFDLDKQFSYAPV